VLIEKEEKNNVLFFGRLSPYKGLDIFLKAASIVAQKIENCRFVIAGKPIQNYKVPSLPDLPKGSTFNLQTKYITNSQLCTLMQQASLVVCPYIDASQSGVVLTAYAFNRPIVATNVGGIPEYIEDGVTGKIVPLKNPEALAAAIIDLLSNVDLRNQMSETIKGTKNKWLNWDNSALEMMNIYKKLLPEGNCE
jgi:glycosyltransferase involved in cell wall biosynthesis